MRGSGKTFIGQLAASVLDWSFIDADSIFEEKHKIGVREFVHANGWPAFRIAETEILSELLSQYGEKHVISLGGGIVETPAARDVLKGYANQGGPVVHVKREIDEVVKYLGEETARPAYGEPVTAVFERREPWYEECSNYVFVNYTRALSEVQGKPVRQHAQPQSYAQQLVGLRTEVHRFFNHVTGQRPNLVLGINGERRSYFLSLTFPDITPALPYIDTLTSGVDAVEVRVDLLRSPKDIDSTSTSYVPPVAYVTEQITALRQRTDLPIVFTARTTSQGGQFPDGADEAAFQLFYTAIRLGVEYIDVEISWPELRIQELVKRKGYSSIIASWHDWSGKLQWTGQEVQARYKVASAFGDVVKIVSKADSLDGNLALYQFVQNTRSSKDAKPIIAINMGFEGQLSRILNSTLSPVTHPLLPVRAAPGQLSFTQIQTGLRLIGQLPAKRFFLFGNPIKQSLSPLIHNTAFELLGLPHRYELMETDTVGEQIKTVIRSPEFGGASVTIPFKLDIVPLLDTLLPEAQAIGAVNTIVPIRNADGSTSLLGTNTDWLGISHSIRSVLPVTDFRSESALVIGAGGTSRAAIYALQKLGIKYVYLYNRTKTAAQELVDAFPTIQIRLVDRLGQWDADGQAPTVIISTIPATAISVNGPSDTALYLPSSLFVKNREGVVVDMAYTPNATDTPLLSLASSVASHWKRVKGVHVLLQQAYGQFQLWTGIRCPKALVSERVLKSHSTQSIL